MKKLIIISGPSGAGEDSVIKGLETLMPIERVITTTTREMRVGESEGNPYHFISSKAFQLGLENDEFFEHAKQDRGNYYGVTHAEIQRVRESHKIGIWKVDYKGVFNAKNVLPPSETVAIFISAPLSVIKQRLKLRDGGHSEVFIQERLSYAEGWFDHRDIFDYEVENVQGKLDQTIANVVHIISEELGLDKTLPL